MTVTHPDYAILAARIAVSNLHKQTKKQFSQVISDLYHYVNPVRSIYIHMDGGQHANNCAEEQTPVAHDLQEHV